MQLLYSKAKPNENPLLMPNPNGETANALPTTQTQTLLCARIQQYSLVFSIMPPTPEP
jgi:hypothetical protein